MRPWENYRRMLVTRLCKRFQRSATTHGANGRAPETTAKKLRGFEATLGKLQKDVGDTTWQETRQECNKIGAIGKAAEMTRAWIAKQSRSPNRAFAHW